MEKFDIESIFEGIPKDEIPNNRPKCILRKNPWLIVAGATCENYFAMELSDQEEIESIEVIYRQMEQLCIVKVPEIIDRKETFFIVKVSFTPEESIAFRDTLIDTKAEVKVTCNNGVFYSNIFKIKVIDALEGPKFKF